MTVERQLAWAIATNDPDDSGYCGIPLSDSIATWRVREDAEKALLDGDVKAQFPNARVERVIIEINTFGGK